MTTVVTSSHRSPAGEAASGAAAPLPQWPQTLAPCRPITPKSPRENRSAFAPTAQSVSHGLLRRPAHRSRRPPGRQIAIDGNRPPRPPRVPSLEAFGRRPSVPADRSPMGRHPKPFTTPAAAAWQVSGRNLPETGQSGVALAAHLEPPPLFGEGGG